MKAFAWYVVSKETGYALAGFDMQADAIDYLKSQSELVRKYYKVVPVRDMK